MSSKNEKEFYIYRTLEVAHKGRIERDGIIGGDTYSSRIGPDSYAIYFPTYMERQRVVATVSPRGALIYLPPFQSIPSELRRCVSRITGGLRSARWKYSSVLGGHRVLLASWGGSRTKNILNIRGLMRVCADTSEGLMTSTTAGEENKIDKNGVEKIKARKKQLLSLYETYVRLGVFQNLSKPSVKTKKLARLYNAYHVAPSISYNFIEAFNENDMEDWVAVVASMMWYSTASLSKKVLRIEMPRHEFMLSIYRPAFLRVLNRWAIFKAYEEKVVDDPYYDYFYKGVGTPHIV